MASITKTTLREIELEAALFAILETIDNWEYRNIPLPNYLPTSGSVVEHGVIRDIEVMCEKALKYD